MQIVALGILKYCLRGMLAPRQRRTFFLFLDTIQRVLQESHTEDALDKLEQDLNEALALLERDFPVSKQVGQIRNHQKADTSLYTFKCPIANNMGQ